MPIDSSARRSAGTPSTISSSRKARRRAKIVAEGTEPGEDRPRGDRIVVEGRQRHQADEADGLQAGGGPHDGARLVRRGAELRRLAGEVDLHVDLRMAAALGRGLVEAAQEIQRVDGVDRVERPARLACLVRLQVADQVPAQIGMVGGERVDLGEGFLDAVLAEVALAGGDRGADGVQAERLGDGDEPDGIRRPAARLGGTGDPRPHRVEVGGDGRRVERLAHFGSCARNVLTCSAYCPVGAYFR
jgi:hypothetical protein